METILEIKTMFRFNLKDIRKFWVEVVIEQISILYLDNINPSISRLAAQFVPNAFVLISLYHPFSAVQVKFLEQNVTATYIIGDTQVYFISYCNCKFKSFSDMT